MSHARPYPQLYRYANMGRRVYARYGRELLRVMGGLPDPPHKLEDARVDLLQCLVRLAAVKLPPRQVAEARDIAMVLELRGRTWEAAKVRAWGGRGVKGRQELAAEAHYASLEGPVGIRRARNLKWAMDRL